MTGDHWPVSEWRLSTTDTLKLTYHPAWVVAALGHSVKKGLAAIHPEPLKLWKRATTHIEYKSLI